MRRKTNWILLLTMMLFVTSIAVSIAGCGLAPKIEAHPDAPRLILATFCGWEKSAVYDKENNVMRSIGWEWVGSKYIGWTRHKFNWQEEVIIPEAAERGIK